ncbi:Uncharacterized membrane protein, DUF4010 family [Bosea sp. OK403]|uniref:MgtC/SapB family protein n=1 Tax=Bosea sp. OK403 TaxID=1855286 RepID=UPI0008E783CB|nr:DUF4010 domain-containing protein [Bosea sp. OK403]SFI05215.1 Uncharacterized membrane protein, DUF4010 family [Bosea sp. OK403]
MTEDVYFRFGVALAIGLVIGIERGWRDRDGPPGSRTAGIRTFALAGLLGAVSATVARDMAAPFVFIALLIAFTSVFAWFKVREADEDNDFSVTSVVAALLVFVLGAYCVVGSPQTAAAAGVAAAGLLASRDFLHGALARLTWPELRSALLLLAMSVIVLPILPNTAIDPFGSVNPREVWIFTVLAGAISYFGYIAVRLLGASRGLLVTSAAGALVSSTAVTVLLARRAGEGEATARLAGAAALAGMISILRVLVLVAAVAPAVLVHAGPAALAGAGAFGMASLLLLRSSGQELDGKAPPLTNPFDLQPLLAFAVTLTLVLLLVGWLTSLISQQGLFLSSGLVGLVDVDVAALTAARNVEALGGPRRAAIAILLALAVNAVARVGYAMITGPLAFSAWLLLITGAAFGCGLSILAILAL